MCSAVSCLQNGRKRSAGKGGGPLKKSMNAWNIVVVHLKENMSSIKQTWWTGPIHQDTLWISYWVQLRRDKCRTSSVFPRLPIDGDHHCDVAFYLTACSFKTYIIPNTDISKDEDRWGEVRRAWIWLYLIFHKYLVCSKSFGVQGLNRKRL